jgi:hypothetical protein
LAVAASLVIWSPQRPVAHRLRRAEIQQLALPLVSGFKQG